LSGHEVRPSVGFPDPMDPWLLRVAEQTAAERGPGDRLGSLALIDQGAVLRGIGAVNHGSIVSLSRTIESGLDHCGISDGLDWFVLQVDKEESTGDIQTYHDRLVVGCHGYNNTHLDALNHKAYRGSFYGGTEAHLPQEREEAPSIVDWARTGIATRGVLVDIPSVRGTAWVSDEEPVTAEDIEEGLRQAEVIFEPGDALLLYCGRDRFEKSGQILPRQDAPIRPGVGDGAAAWIAANDVSILCWDMMDARHPSQPFLPVHRLIWAAGLAIVDSCDHGELHSQATGYGQYTGLLIVAPLAIPGGTGSLVNPLMLL
jgi:kynurenine formamidase